MADTCLSDFVLLSDSDVRVLILASNKKYCPLDPIPTKLLIDCLDVLLPTIAKMINLSLAYGYFPAAWKSAIVRPLLDLAFKNFRPISNLQYISKLMETVVAKQLQSYLSLNHLLPLFQSAYRPHHSTESALIKIKNDILMIMNKRHVTLLDLLDLSGAIDTVDHTAPKTSVFIWHTRLSSIKLYHICQGDLSASWSMKRFLIASTLSAAHHRALGPLLFTMYTSKLSDIVKAHLLNVHCYADDTQVYLSFSPHNKANDATALSNMENCKTEIRSWMLSDKLKLNDSKTEFLIIGTSQQLVMVKIDRLRVGDSDVLPVSTASNLEVWFGSRLASNGPPHRSLAYPLPDLGMTASPGFLAGSTVANPSFSFYLKDRCFIPDKWHISQLLQDIVMGYGCPN